MDRVEPTVSPHHDKAIAGCTDTDAFLLKPNYRDTKDSIAGIITIMFM